MHAMPMAIATTANTTPTVMPTLAPIPRPLEEEVNGAGRPEFGEDVGAGSGTGAVEDLGKFGADVIVDKIVGIGAVLELGSTVLVIGTGSSAKLYPDTRNPVTVMPPSPFAAPVACRLARLPDKLLITIADPEGTIETHLLSSAR